MLKKSSSYFHIIVPLIIGFGVNKFTLIPITVIFLFSIKWISLKKPTLPFFIISLFLFFYWLLHRDNVQYDFSFNAIYYIIFLFYLYIFIYVIPKKNLEVSILSLTIGLLLFSSLFVYYSLFKIDPPFYANLYNPFSGEIGNSSIVASYSSYFPVLLPAFILKFGNKIKKSYLFIFIILYIQALFNGIVCVGRLFFLVNFISIIFYSFVSRKFIFNKLTLLLISIFVLIFNYFKDLLGLSIIYVFYRFENEGLESVRLGHFMHFVENFPSKWHTQIEPDAAIGNQNFHNIFLDIHLESGIFLMIFFILIFFYFIILYIKRKWYLSSFYNILLIVSFIMINVGVIVEGDIYHLFIFFIVFMVVINIIFTKN